MSRKEWVESYSRMHEASYKLAVEIRKSAMTRLVWFTAISGYALINGRLFWETVRGQSLTGVVLFWLSLPWGVSALLSIVTHFFVDEFNQRESQSFITKQSALDQLRIKHEEGKENPQEFRKILYDDFPGVKEAKASADRFEFVVRWLERATFFSLMVSFIWTVIGPLLLP
jgi:hypothetical protein